MSQLKECASLLDTIHRSINHLKTGSSFGRSGGGGFGDDPRLTDKGNDTPNASHHVVLTDRDEDRCSHSHLLVVLTHLFLPRMEIVRRSCNSESLSWQHESYSSTDLIWFFFFNLQMDTNLYAEYKTLFSNTEWFNIPRLFCAAMTNISPLLWFDLLMPLETSLSHIDSINPHPFSALQNVSQRAAAVCFEDRFTVKNP